MYRVHHIEIQMTKEERLERFLNTLEGEVVAIIPNIVPFPATYVNFVLVVEKLPDRDESPAFRDVGDYAATG